MTGRVPEELRGALSEPDGLAVAVSGGLDSEVLLRAAAEVRGRDGVLALTADSPLLADHYRRVIRSLVGGLGVPHRFVRWDPMSVPGVRANGPDRCYHCKRTIYTVLGEAGREEDVDVLADGTNTDDPGGDRPGMRAAEESGVRRPFLDAGMGRTDVERLGRALGMTGRPRPDDSCLATRIPEGTPLLRRELALVEELEAPLRPIVRQRLRVYLEGTRAVVHYRKADSTAISRLKETLKDRARGEGIRRVIFVMED
ncbi:MAG: hypothetical protein R6U36_08095 [Candidatus Fermentibacteraceae bacterium]